LFEKEDKRRKNQCRTIKLRYLLKMLAKLKKSSQSELLRNRGEPGGREN